MTLGMSTRAVSAPLGTAGAFAPTMPAVKLVPLSVFFLDRAEDGEDDQDAMYGLQKPSKEGEDTEGRQKGKKKKRGKRSGKTKVDTKASGAGVKGGDGREDETVGVGKKEPPGAPVRPAAGGPEPPKSESRLVVEAKGKISKPQKCKYCDNSATKACIWADGRAYIPVCDGHEKAAKTRIEKTNRDKVTAIRPIPQRQTTAEQTPFNVPVLTPIKTGATRASSGAMGTGNIARYHVPLGPPLRRVTPIGDEEEKKKKKRRRRRLKGEDRDNWIERLIEIAK